MYQISYAQIDLDDLHDPESSAGILLEMQDRQRYFEGGIQTQNLATQARLQVSGFRVMSTRMQ
jgi:transcription initiation factor TFIIH subunit 1